MSIRSDRKWAEKNERADARDPTPDPVKSAEAAGKKAHELGREGKHAEAASQGRFAPK